MSRALTTFRLAEAMATRVPLSVSQALCRPVGVASRIYARSGRAMASRHQQRVTPGLSDHQMQRRVDAVFESYARYWIESLRLPRISKQRVINGITVHGYVHVVNALERGNGAILALPHLGGWEWAGRWLADRGVRVVAVAERLKDESVDRYLTEVRASLGIEVISLDDRAGISVMSALRENAVVCLLCDRDLQGNGVEVTFFGETTTIPAGPVALAMRTGASLLPTAVYHTPRRDGHIGVVLPEIALVRSGSSLRVDLATYSQQLVGALEDLIGRAPQQWHLLQPNWPSDI